MNPLTDNAKAVLVSIARMVGEPGGGPFGPSDIATYHNVHDLDAAARKEREEFVYSSGLSAKTIPALKLRGFVERRGHGQYYLTDAGYEEAERISGGRGLL